MSDPRTGARSSALAIAVVSGASVGLDALLEYRASGSVAKTLAVQSQYFTILTNTGVAFTMAALALGKRVPARLLLAVVVAIIGTGLFYHLLLASIDHPEGLHKVTNFGLHTVTPIACALWWLVYSRNSRQRVSDAVFGMIWPLIYCFLALTRAAFSGTYPYPFIDLSKLGWQRLLVNIAGLGVGFWAIGAVLLLAAWWTQKRRPGRTG